MDLAFSTFLGFVLKILPFNRPELSGGMDWWPFSRARKIFFRARNLHENPCNSAERVIFAKFQAPKFEIAEPPPPQKKNNSIPPAIPYPH